MIQTLEDVHRIVARVAGELSLVLTRRLLRPGSRGEWVRRLREAADRLEKELSNAAKG